MPDYIVNPQTGETLNIPEQFGQYVGLPRFDVADPVYDPSEEGTPVQGSPRQSVDEMLAIKKAKYAKLGASPDQMSQWLDIDRNRYEKYVRDVTKPPPGSSPEAVDAWLAQSPSHAPGSPTQYAPPQVPARVAQMLAPPSDVAHFTQSTAPLGTIGMIGKDGSGAARELSPSEWAALQPEPMTPDAVSGASAVVPGDPAATAIPPPPAAPGGPVPPEQAGADLSRQSLGMQEDAAKLNSAADQKQADAELAALEDQKRRVEETRAQTAREDAEKQQRFDSIRANVTKTTDDWAKTKIDPGRRWKSASTGSKIAAAISVAMSALGDALQHKSGPNLALQIIDKAIQDDVDLQVQDRQHKGDIANRARTSLDDYRKEYGDWQQARAAKLVEEYKKTADDIELGAARAKTDRAKAFAVGAVAELRGRAGALEQGIATSAWNREMKEQEFAENKRNARVSQGLQAQGLKQNADQFSEEMKFKRDQLTAQQKAATDEYLAKASAEQAKELKETGIKDPTTGEYIIANGKPVSSRNAAEATKIQETVDGTQTMLSTIDRIKAKIANDPGFAKLNPTQKQAALASELDSLTLLIKDAYGTGALDKGSIEFTNGYTGGDPTKLTASGLFGSLGLGADSGDKTTAKLDVVAKTAETRALNRLGNPKGWKFTRDEKTQETAANKAALDVQKGTPTTAKELQDQQPGAFAKGLQDVESFVFGTKQKYKGDAEAAEGRGNSARYPGFRADKEAALDTLVQAAQSGDEQAKTRIVEMVGNKKTPGLSPAAMTLVDTIGDPALTARAEAALPAEIRAQRRAIEAGARQGRGPGIQLYPGHGVPLPQPGDSDLVPVNPRSAPPLDPAVQRAVNAAIAAGRMR